MKRNLFFCLWPMMLAVWGMNDLSAAGMDSFSWDRGPFCAQDADCSTREVWGGRLREVTRPVHGGKGERCKLSRSEGQAAVYLESFENVGAWTVEDPAGKMRGGGAQIQNVQAVDGSCYLTSGYDDQPRNAKATSPIVALEGGVEYDVSIWAFAPGYGALLEEFKLLARDLASGEETVLLDYSGNLAEKLKDWKRLETTFVPALGGPYQFELIHCTRECDVNIVAFDRFYVGKTPDDYEPEMPELLPAPTKGEFKDVLYTCATRYTYKYALRTQLVFGEQDSVFVKGICPSMPSAWIYGKRTGNRVAFPSQQFVGVYATNGRQYNIFFEAGKDHGFTESGALFYTPLDSLHATLTEDGCLVIDNPAISVESAANAGTLDYAENQLIAPFTGRLAYPTAHAVRQTMQYSSHINGSKVYRLVELATDADTVYVSGFCQDTPGTWLKGLKVGDNLQFPAHQYMGMFGDYPISFVPLTLSEEGDMQENDHLLLELQEDGSYSTGAQFYQTQINDGYDAYYTYADTRLEDYRKVAAAPSPALSATHFMVGGDESYVELNYSPVNAEGYVMELDDLYYRVYLDGRLFHFTTSEYPLLPENSDEISVTYSDGWNFHDFGGPYTKLFSFTKTNYVTMEIEMAYHCDGKVWLSERIKANRYDPNGITPVPLPAETPVSTELFDLRGRRVTSSAHGVLICRHRYADGSVRTEKMVVR